MNSLKSKSTDYSIVNGKAVAGVVLIPEAGHFRVYVAWEWQNMAEKGFFAITESSHLIGHISPEFINTVADYGNDVTHIAKARKLFPELF